MLVLVYDNEIAGETESLDQLPTGFSAFEHPRAPLDSLFFDGKDVKVKPSKPSESANWSDNQWIEPIVTELPTTVEKDIYDFDTAIIEAETNPLVLVALVRALYAKMRGDTELVEQIAEDFKVYKAWKDSQENLEVKDAKP